MRFKWLMVGALSLALLALCAGIVAVSWFGIARQQAGGVSWRLFSADTVSAEADEEQRFVVSGPAVLSVENLAGDIIVTGGEGSEIVVKAHKTGWGSDQADAQAALAALKVNITQDGSTVTVRAGHVLEIYPAKRCLDSFVWIERELKIENYEGQDQSNKE